MSSALTARLADLAARQTPGISTAVVSGDGAVRFESAGVADLESRQPASPDTVYLWFSMTKIVTATATMQLVEDGVLRLDDPVDRYIPSFPRPRAGWPRVEIRHLLSHSSGLANPLPVRWVHRADEEGRDPHRFALELLTKHRRLRSRAGAKALYSNLGYIALGEVVAAASGNRFEDQVRSRILGPLGMSRTGFAYSSAGHDEVARGHQRRLHPMMPLFRLLLPKGIIGSANGRFVSFHRFLVDGPAYGGLVGPVSDAVRFMSAHLNGPGSTGSLLDRRSISSMQTRQASGRTIDVGYGWFRRGSDRSRAEFWEHLGGGGGFWCMMRIFPERQVGVLSMGNATSYDHGAIAEAALADAQSGVS